MLLELLRSQRQELQRIAERHGAFNLRVFGSTARGDADSGSDIDLLIEAGPVTSSWFPAGLVLELEALLGRHVDVVTEGALRPELREIVLREAVPL